MSVGIQTVSAALNPAVGLVNNVNTQVVQANSSAEAIALAKALHADDNDAVSGAATVVLLSSIPVLTGWVFRVQVTTMTPTDVSVTGDADDTLDDINAKLVTALNAAGTGITHSSYNSTTNVLTVAAGATDALGDLDVTITITPPTGLFVSGYTWSQSDVVASVTEGGMSSDDLKVTYSTTWVVPGRISGYNRGS